jgi:hypothetical protein
VLTVNPHIAFAPATVRIKVMQIPDGAKTIAVLIEGPWSTSSEQSVAGRRSVLFPDYKDLPEGDYLITVWIDSLKQTQTVRIIGQNSGDQLAHR